MRRALAIAVVLGSMAFSVTAAQAAVVTATWVTGIGTTSADLRAEINPQGQPTTYIFEYTPEVIYRAKGFAGAAKIPATGISIGGGTVLQHTSGLQPETTYRFRAVANSAVAGPIRQFTTREAEPVFSLPDSRGWEMVSPVDKNGGGIQSFGENFGGGVIQAAAQGGAVTYTSSSSFENPPGAPGAGQYLSTRGGSGWSTQNITLPGLSGTYPEAPTSGVPYQFFSSDLQSALVSNGRRCRSSASSNCPVENAPLAGSGAPAGFRNYYLRNDSNGSFAALLTGTDLADLTLGAEDFEVAIAGTTPDLAHIVISTCAALTAGATEVPGTVPGGECAAAKQNLYEKSGATLTQINTAPGATLAAQSGAISANGSRVYWTNGTALYLREGAATKQVDQTVGGGGTFQAASADGSVAFFTKAGHLYRYEAVTETTIDLTPGGVVVGVLGASEDGTYVYYVTASGAFLWHSGVVTPVASQVEAGNYPPTTGTARVSADGRHLLFVSSAFELVDYDSRNLSTGVPEPEVYLFTAPGSPNPGLTCASCNPDGERPVGAASLPGASPNGSALDFYKPRVLSANSGRVFFDTSDALAPQDTNGTEDVYEWEAPGFGSCTKSAGCVGLISSGRAEGGASILDASADGSDVFFLTDGSLVPSDPGANDVYDAREGGGFPPPETPVPCFGDACQPLPPEPEDPTPGTARTRASGNLPTAPPKKPLKCKKGMVKKFGKCVKKNAQKQARKTAQAKRRAQAERRRAQR
jgi:hypothetical protein